MQSVRERKKHGQRICLEINKKLDSGWLPYYSNATANEFKTFEYCKIQFLQQIQSDINKNIKRVDTLRSYSSMLAMIDKYIAEKKINLKMMLEYNRVFLVNFLDWILYERNNSPRTYNNHLLFARTFINHCVGRGYLKENFAVGLPKKQETAKVRQILTFEVKQKLKLLEAENFNFFVLCMATYFCFLRRTELTKLKVDDIFIANNYIQISGESSKNKKSESVTIPSAYIGMLATHLQNAKNTDFLFSDNNFKAGSKQLNPKKISDVWAKFRIEKNVPNIYQFYSLKDTGITDLLNSGIAAIKVRDQARHYDLKITEKYTARNKGCDDAVKNSNFEF